MTRIPFHHLSKGQHRLPNELAHYVVHVLRKRLGDVLQVFDPKNGLFAEAVLTVIDSNDVFINIGTVEKTKQHSRIAWVQGYPKGDKFSEIVRDATELGATVMIPAICERTIARPHPNQWFERQNRWQKVAEQAARQCGRMQAPSLQKPMSWQEALNLIRPQVKFAYVLWERSTQPIGLDLVQISQQRVNDSIAFCVGPEGGLTQKEIDEALQLDFQIRSIGNTILRTETVVAAMLGAWQIVSAQSS